MPSIFLSMSIFGSICTIYIYICFFREDEDQLCQRLVIKVGQLVAQGVFEVAETLLTLTTC